MRVKRSVGWIGLGKMGAPMATNLVTSGHPVSVYNRTAERAETLVEMGARYLASLEQLGAASDVIFSMIADDSALFDITVGKGGVFQTMKEKSIFVDMSTVSPSASARVAAAAREYDIAYLRAPVSGSTSAARSRALTILVSGPQQAFADVAEMLKVIGKSIHYLGDGEQSRYLKLSINLMVGITAAMMGEALTLSSRGGVDWQQMLNVINDSAVASPLVGYKKAMLAERNFAPMFSSNQMAKDLDLALDTGREQGVVMPLVAMVRQLFCAMQSEQMAELDFFAYVTLVERLSGVTPVLQSEY